MSESKSSGDIEREARDLFYEWASANRVWFAWRSSFDAMRRKIQHSVSSGKMSGETFESILKEEGYGKRYPRLPFALLDEEPSRRKFMKGAAMAAGTVPLIGMTSRIPEIYTPAPVEPKVEKPLDEVITPEDEEWEEEVYEGLTAYRGEDWTFITGFITGWLPPEPSRRPRKKKFKPKKS